MDHRASRDILNAQLLLTCGNAASCCGNRLAIRILRGRTPTFALWIGLSTIVISAAHFQLISRSDTALSLRRRQILYQTDSSETIRVPAVTVACEGADRIYVFGRTTALTEEFKDMLDRDLAIAEAAPLIDAACPLLREMVNHGTKAFVRVLRAADVHGGVDEDLAVYLLYRQMLELTDAIDVLFRHSVVDGTVPVVRSAFEISLSLDYILHDPDRYSQRCLSWWVGYMHNRLAAYERLDAKTAPGSHYATTYEKEFSEIAHPQLAPFDSEAQGVNLRTVLARPHFAAIEADFQERRRSKRPRAWFSLMDGPTNRQELARAVGREAEYLSFYAEWSGFSHASDGSGMFGPGRQPGEVAFPVLRTARHMPHRAFVVVRWVLRATRQMIQHFRPGENLEPWYGREVQARWHALARLHADSSEA